jgi:hypothetical protein
VAARSAATHLFGFCFSELCLTLLYSATKVLIFAPFVMGEYLRGGRYYSNF